MRATILILLALLIDGLQAGFSFGLFVIGVFPGTVAGTAGGCALGASIAGKAGCFIGGLLVGAVGTAADPFLAPITASLAIGLGFAVNLCIDVTLGTMLILLLKWFDMFYLQYGLAGALIELIPGINDGPVWTVTVILAIIRKRAEERALQGGAAGVFAMMLSPTTWVGRGAAAISTLKQRNMQMARDAGVITEEQQDAQRETQQRRVSSELKNIDGIRPGRQALRTPEPISYGA